MATITQVVCDKCRSTTSVVPVEWSIGSDSGQIDLCPSCLRSALKTVTLPSQKIRTPAPVAPEKPSHSAVRSWAKEQGLDCPVKGRIPTEVMQAYANRNKAPSLQDIAS